MPAYQEKDTAQGKQFGTSTSQKIGFHGATPVAQRAGAAQAVATDAATTMALANELRAALVALGLVKGAA
jgi:hypothetical protein